MSRRFGRRMRRGFSLPRAEPRNLKNRGRMEVSPMVRMIFDRRQLLAAAAGMCSFAAGTSAAGAQVASNRPEKSGSNGDRALIPRRLLFADPARSVVRISPDGRRVAFLAPVDGVLNLWVGVIDDIANARALTRVTDQIGRAHV